MKIIFPEPIGMDTSSLEKLQQELHSAGHTMEFFKNKPSNDIELLNRIKNAEIICLSNIPLRREVLSNCKELKFLNIAFTGTDHIDLNYCKENNIKVSNAAGYSTEAVAELCVGASISLYRNFLKNHELTKSLEGVSKSPIGFELNAKTVGIVGTGKIGKRTAEIFKAFNCKLLGYNRTEKYPEIFKYVDLETLFRNSDIISIHLPLTNETKGLINASLLSKMKKKSILINTARGNIIDYQYLVEMLNSEKISGAAIDVYEYEPPLQSDHPLLSAKNILLLPHIGYYTQEAMNKRFDIVKNNLFCYLNGKTINSIV
ncbi:MAG TPA: NAD(P)-dependent oxidoreductase [Bacteroidales bacterium]|jgi:D-3-phosphoglycerate dehydrogenase|nr:NAD(P)-dependent oxidoreductase [Bacteroidales bacterium]HOL97796.1 NAD(P)-dependent oxidoreductase [Bacteroidales bacterium]HOM35845.1 NAD(P)-dependent oxidoreductase [Bacteroidales bacterium]HPD23236.1 NAD(P)-dependent oxidoreductase [Bacteroidales bacterium]HRS99240.1 NAD(P)-dependent oxidoreductase [Bacteroidales bacterium]